MAKRDVAKIESTPVLSQTGVRFSATFDGKSHHIFVHREAIADHARRRDLIGDQLVSHVNEFQQQFLAAAMRKRRTCAATIDLIILTGSDKI